MFYKSIIAFIFFQLIILPFASGNALQEYTKKISEEYTFSSDSPSIDISNKYGNVDIMINSSNEASIDIVITVEAKNKERGQDILDRIEIVINHSNSSLDVETELENMKTKRNESFQIDYKVSVPQRSKLSIYNKYGNISAEALHADTDIELHYGNGSFSDIDGNVELELSYTKRFSIGSVSGDIDAEMSYSEVSITSCNDMKLENKYSEIDIDEAKSIKSDSRYSEITIGRIGFFENEGKYDDIHLEHADNVIFDGKYSHLKIETLTSSLESYTGYGSVKIGQLDSSFEKVIIDGSYTPVTIRSEGGFSLDIETKYTDVDYPSDMDIQNREKDSNELTLQGKKNGSGNGMIKAKMKYGKLHIR